MRDASPLCKQDGFGVYVHWPFCLSKCPYCDFNSHVRHTGIDEARLVDGGVAHMAVEVAIRAFRQAERPMDVDAECRIVGRGHGPTIWQLGRQPSLAHDPEKACPGLDPYGIHTFR